MGTATHIRNQLQACKGDWPTICTVTGLSYWWLIKFAQGRIAEPGLSKIERLQAYFHGNAPAVAPGAPAADNDDVDPDHGRIDPDIEGA